MKIRKYACRFEPSRRITTPREFTNELIKYCSDHRKELTIIKESMEPMILIDEKKYTCFLEPIFTGKNYGFKWIYMYEEM